MGNRVSNAEETRQVIAGEIAKADNKRSNRIKTSKYSIITFVPKNLVEQFRRLANFYFLIVSLIAVIIDSPVSPLTSLAPLAFVIIVTMAKQGYEDWLRHRLDNAVNNELVSVLKNSTLQQIKCHAIRPGELVKIGRDCDVPCDTVLLWSSDSRGKCFVTTANLDGETSLKPLKVPSPLINTTIDGKIKSTIKIEVLKPEPDIYTFYGKIAVDDGGTFPIGTDNLLLRGSRLKNTEWAIGCAVYTGEETKLALNSRFTSNKFTSCEKYINNYLIFFIVLMLIEIIVSYALKRHLEKVKSAHLYIGITEANTSFKAIAQDAFSFLLLYYYCIPISLYVTIELQKFFGSMYLEWDRDLYCGEIDQPPLVNTSDLNEELGQIEILFSDKTGTLTKNDMHFQMCSVNGRCYVEKNRRLYEMNDNWIDGETVEALQILEPDIQFFFTILALCHTVQVEEASMAKINSRSSKRKDAGFINNNTVDFEELPIYQAMSSDEIAFVKAAANRGIVFYGDDVSKMFIKYNGDTIIYERLNTLEFTSTRRRMSVIVKDSAGQIWLFCKGAESALLPLCLDSPILSKINDDVQYFAEKGLRTLAVAYKKISKEEYSIINDELIRLNMDIRGRSSKTPVDSWRSIEQGLTLIGATAVEDRLQDNVTETMEALRIAGIKIWVLTGDKAETAINVAQSCGHIPSKSKKLFLTEILTRESLDEQLNHCETVMDELVNAHITLVLDGQSLGLILNTPNETRFSDMSLKCESVICCRLSPLQKALIVRLIKKSPGRPVTAAVGDGANDISMIQEAHVGFGIFGKEGRQAARSSDFAFASFQMLKKILLVHGHWYYQRLATLIQYSFYKNLAFVNLMLFYQIQSNFSTQTVFDSMFLSLYNLFFVSAPIFAISLTEQCHSSGLLMSNPILYKNQRKNKLLSTKYFLTWCLTATYHSVIIYGFCCILWQINPVISKDGMSAEFWSFGAMIFHLLVVIANLKLLINARYQTAIFVVVVFLSILVFMALSATYSSIYLMYDGDVTGTYTRLLASPVFWLLNLVTIVACLYPDFTHIALKGSMKTRNAKIEPEFFREMYVQNYQNT
ncbi:phospholipid-transporting ATPase IF-like [Arctopsyche grandis]|uniref:phospholipid-transporting ATPase IF-like n=1 Tax=Arctopsyche grandis TaxID=121162 RepID=UPI00406D7B8F